MKKITANGTLSESEEQKIIFRWAEYSKGAHPELSLLFAVPNGGSRNRIEAHNLKLEGVKAGVPDICLPVPCGDYHGLYIELKRTKGGVISDAQKEWIEMLNERGYLAVVAKGANEAIKVISDYLKG